MYRIFALTTRMLGDKRGVTAMEYGVLAAGIVVAVAAAATMIGGKLTTKFTAIAGLL